MVVPSQPPARYFYLKKIIGGGGGSIEGKKKYINYATKNEKKNMFKLG